MLEALGIAALALAALSAIFLLAPSSGASARPAGAAPRGARGAPPAARSRALVDDDSSCRSCRPTSSRRLAGVLERYAQVPTGEARARVADFFAGFGLDRWPVRS